MNGYIGLKNMITLYEQLNGKAVGILHHFLDCLKDSRRRLENVDKAMYEQALLNSCPTEVKDYVEINKSQFKDFQTGKMVIAIEEGTGIIRVCYGAYPRLAWDIYEPTGSNYRFAAHRKTDWKTPHVFFATNRIVKKETPTITLSSAWLRDFERQVGPLRNILPDTNDSSIDRYVGLWQLKKGMKPSDYDQLSRFCSVLGLSLYGDPEQSIPKALEEFSSMKPRLVEAILKKVEDKLPKEIVSYMTNFVNLLLKL
jgi:hypothetical protein